ncbi:DMT family transporter [Sandarakinorhabdus sp.]|jgi:drug/metabolite transporter (DMT)-like permease|uniref:DMT family transporter n=1 Tax=Sandarakinorhabdus sp. TaxID=1916663 RepID=UPI0028A62780|nr:DMT family transporter [Sandarakinorhabdus sp.]
MGSTDNSAQAGARWAFPAMITGSACLAFGPWLVRLADVGPLASAFWRQALAVPFLFALALVAGRRQGHAPFAGSTVGLVGLAALAGFAFAADLSVWHLGIMRTTLANSTLLANAATFLLPLYGLVVLGQRLTRPQWWALAAAAAGVALLLGRSAEVSARHFAGDLLCLAAAVFYTIYLIAIEKVRGTLDAMPALVLATLASALALAPLAASGAFWPQDWTPVLGLAIGSQVVGQGLIVYAVRHLSPLVVGLTLLVQPAISAIIGALRFGEVPGPLELVGAGLVVAALLIARLPSRA